jgi:hypothetical protein
MTQPIYKVFLGKPTEAWYQLSKAERDDLMAKNAAAVKEVGSRFLIMANSDWCSEQWLFWGVSEFPDMDAVMKYHERLAELNWFRYYDALTLLGTEMPVD